MLHVVYHIFIIYHIYTLWCIQYYKIIMFDSLSYWILHIIPSSFIVALWPDIWTSKWQLVQVRDAPPLAPCVPSVPSALVWGGWMHGRWAPIWLHKVAKGSPFVALLLWFRIWDRQGSRCLETVMIFPNYSDCKQLLVMFGRQEHPANVDSFFVDIIWYRIRIIEGSCI